MGTLTCAHDKGFFNKLGPLVWISHGDKIAGARPKYHPFWRHFRRFDLCLVAKTACPGPYLTITITVRNPGLGLVTVDAVLQALMVVYERQLAAYHTEVRQDGGASMVTGGSPRGRRADGAQEQPAPQRSSRPRRGAAKGADAAGPTG